MFANFRESELDFPKKIHPPTWARPMARETWHFILLLIYLSMASWPDLSYFLAISPCGWMLTSYICPGATPHAITAFLSAQCVGWIHVMCPRAGPQLWEGAASLINLTYFFIYALAICVQYNITPGNVSIVRMCHCTHKCSRTLVFFWS